jgi:hypothetical protein
MNINEAIKYLNLHTGVHIAISNDHYIIGEKIYDGSELVELAEKMSHEKRMNEN